MAFYLLRFRPERKNSRRWVRELIDADGVTVARQLYSWRMTVADRNGAGGAYAAPLAEVKPFVRRDRAVTVSDGYAQRLKAKADAERAERTQRLANSIGR